EIRLDPSEQRAGTCLPLDDQGTVEADAGRGPIGQCLEAGGTTEDLPCDLVNRSRSGKNCAPGLACVGGASADIGRCARLCDPLAAPDPCAVAGRACFDNSTGETVRDPQTGAILAQLHGTWGYCRTGTRCQLTTPATCPAGQGCLPTNPVRASGFCSD